MLSIDAYHKMVRLSRIVCCPTCKGDIDYGDATHCGELVINAAMTCHQCGLVGVVRNTKFIFNNNPHFSVGSMANVQGALGFNSRSIDADAKVQRSASGWTWDGQRLWAAKRGARLTLITTAIGIDLRFLRHSWAGSVTLEVNGTKLGTIDLFEDAGSMETSIPIFLGLGEHRVTVTATGEQSSGSNGSQVHLCGIDELLFEPSIHLSFTQPVANRGNPYPDPWNKLVSEASEDRLILDCGSGDRRYDDSRVVNFEYTAFALPDVFGDGHKLPFKDKTFDLILSQAVIEHLYNPFIAVDDIYRVCKHDGIVLAESAFMQPLHAVPYHFFNTTRWGIEKLFERFSVESTQELGTLGDTLSWIYSLTGLEAKGLGDRVADLLAIAKHLDDHISQQEMAKFASFVRIKAVKSHAA